jgi:hypothetical protein
MHREAGIMSNPDSFHRFAASLTVVKHNVIVAHEATSFRPCENFFS